MVWLRARGAGAKTDDRPGYRGSERGVPVAHSNSSATGWSNYDWALAYQRSGLVVIPLWPGTKTPHSSKANPSRALLGGGFKLAEVGECSEEWVRRCWGPEGEPTAGIGVVCGSRSRLLLIDVDTKNSGEFSWEAWRAERSEAGLVLPETPIVRTPSGGYHLWFRLPEGLELRSWDGWLPGVDVLANGHWAGAPPTIVRDQVSAWDSTAYEFQRTCEKPIVPDWLLEELSTGRRRRISAVGRLAESAEYERSVRFDWVRFWTPGAVPGGEQHDTLVSAAHSARAKNLDDDVALAHLIDGVRCFTNEDPDDPWTDQHAIDKWEEAKQKPAGTSFNLDDVEVPDYTPHFESAVIPRETNGQGRAQLRLIHGEGGESESPGEGEDEGGDEGDRELPPGGGWDSPPTLGDTDEEHACEFHRLYGERVLWVPGLEWHMWTGTHWRPDDAHDVDDLLTELGYRIETYRLTLRDREGFEDEFRLLGARVKRLWNSRSVSGVKIKAESYAQHWNGRTQTAECLDTHLTMLNTLTGLTQLAAITERSSVSE